MIGIIPDYIRSDSYITDATTAAADCLIMWQDSKIQIENKIHVELSAGLSSQRDNAKAFRRPIDQTFFIQDPPSFIKPRKILQVERQWKCKHCVSSYIGG